jgi:O-antigen/teichoic acid export membrane protein
MDGKGIVDRKPVKSGFVQGALLSALNAIVSIALPFAVFTYFARVLPPWQFGLVGLTIAWAEIMKIFCPAGLYEALLGEEPDDARHAAAFGLLAAASVLAYGVFVVALHIATRTVPDSQSIFPALCLLGLRMVFDMLLLQPMARIVQRGEAPQLAWRIILANVVASIGGLAIGWRQPLAGLLTYYVAQSVLIFLFAVVRQRAIAGVSLNLSALRSLRRDAAAATGARSLAAVNGYFDQVLIGALLPIRAVADYNVGKRLENALVTGGNSFSSILFQPMFVDRGRARAQIISGSFGMLHLLLAAPVCVLVLNRDFLIPFLFGEQWAQAAAIAATLAGCGLLRAYSFVFIALLSVSRNNGAILRSSLVTAVLGVLAVVAAARWGLLAVAFVLLAKNAATLLYLAHQARSEIPGLFIMTLRRLVLPLLGILTVTEVARWLLVPSMPGDMLTGLYSVILTGAVASLAALLAARDQALALVRRFRPLATT